MRVLGIETSCDETGIAIYDTTQGLVADQLYSQIPLHAQYGGVVPELASRDHIKKIKGITTAALKEAGCELEDIDAIAYTAGPGLVGCLMVGACFGKSLGVALNLPTLGVHHLEAHLMAAMLEEKAPTFPFTALLVSGGHTALVQVHELGVYQILGDTLDDAVGEAFDKTAKLLGLPYPGGAALSRLAEQGHERYQFPRPMIDRPNLDFSFSGLKTHVANVVKTATDQERDYPDIAFAFQDAVVATLAVKTRKALNVTGSKSLVVAGGVGANKQLRCALSAMATEMDVKVYYPRPQYCTDNGAMIAYLGCQRLLAGEQDATPAIQVRARWSLEDLKAPRS